MDYQSSDELESLSREWQKELSIKKSEILEGISYNSPYRIELARRLYVLGLKAETDGKLQLAIEQYRRATVLFPDIEKEIRSIHFAGNKETDSGGVLENSSDFCHDDDADVGSLIPAPILSLPDELLLYIFRWVIGTHIDLHSLIKLSQVCKKFLAVGRDEQLWKIICIRLWPYCSEYDALLFGGSWRSMAAMKAHLLFHGCYIGSTSYIRQGEPTTNIVCSPVLEVKYFRVLKFTSDGRVIMVTSAQEVQEIIKNIKTLDDDISQITLSNAQNGVSIGTYTVVNENIYVRLGRTSDNRASSMRRSRKGPGEDPTKQILEIIFQIKYTPKRPNRVLQWKKYSLTFIRKNETSVTEFDLKSNKFPKLSFSTVKSFVCRMSPEPV